MATERAFIHRPFDGHIIMKPTGVLLLKLDGQNGFRNAGNYEECTYEIESDPEDIFSPQTPERSKIGTLHNDVKVTLNFSLSQAIDIVRSMVMQSDNKLVLDQAAVFVGVVEGALRVVTELGQVLYAFGQKLAPLYDGLDRVSPSSASRPRTSPP